MALTFPINPLNGQQYTDPNIAITWQFDSGRNAWRIVRSGAAWIDITGKPLEFPPSDHEHPIAEITGLQDILDLKQDITSRGLPNGYAPLNEFGKVPENMIELGALTWDSITGKPGVFPPEAHTHPVAEISDSGTTGQQVVKSSDPAMARAAIGAIGPDDNARVGVKKNSILLGTRRAINFIEGTNVTLNVVDDVAQEEVEVTVNSAGGSGGGAAYTVSEIKPAAPFANDLWLDTATGLTFTYYNDGDTAQWIESLPYLGVVPPVFTKFNFPSAPIDDQVFEPIPGAQWKWNTARGVWRAVGSAGAGGGYTQAEADANFVDIDGDAMTGPLQVVHPPTANNHAVSKLYVDSRYALAASSAPPTPPVDNTLWWDSDNGMLYVRYNDGVDPSQWVQAVAFPAVDTSGFVLRSGDTMSGHLSLPITPADANAVRKDYVDAADTAITSAYKLWAAPVNSMAYSGMQINGGFEVSQEIGGAGTALNGKHICDGWKFLFSAGPASCAAYQTGGATGTYAWPGLTSLIYTATNTIKTPLLSSDIVGVYQYIEGFRTSRLAWGGANAQPITIAFWVWHTLPGTYSIGIRNAASDRSYVTTYTASGGMDYKVVTIPGCSDGVWDTLNGTSISVFFITASGPTYTAPTINTWLVGNYLAAPGQVNAIASTSNYCRFGGVVVLPGSYAPSVAYYANLVRPYDQELATCKRYWQKLGGSAAADIYLASYSIAGNTSSWPLTYPVQMRTIPSAAIVGTWATTNGTLSINAAGDKSVSLSLVAAATGNVWTYTVAGCYIALDARL